MVAASAGGTQAHEECATIQAFTDSLSKFKTSGEIFKKRDESGTKSFRGTQHNSRLTDIFTPGSQVKIKENSP